MIVEYPFDPKNPSGAGRVLREIPDGDPFVLIMPAASAVCVATSLIHADPNSRQPWERRLVVELATGHHFWLAPEIQVITASLKAVPTG
jgi:hypothetical protein